ncbi:hypothetical protein ACFL6R_05310 [Gemmatimonadota bacterium]
MAEMLAKEKTGVFSVSIDGGHKRNVYEYVYRDRGNNAYTYIPLIELLHHFLDQGKGSLSKRARTKEYNALTDEEVAFIENVYEECFGEIPGWHQI